jgi:phosphopantothenoylcysteine synthetase/decarboxylase
MTLELAPTEDILAEVVRRRRPGQLIVGFAAETKTAWRTAAPSCCARAPTRLW